MRAASRPARRPTGASAEAGPVECPEQSWTQGQAHRAPGRLPEREREPIAIAYWSEFSQSEVAARLAIPLGTVKTRTRSGLERLSQIPADELES